MKLHRQRQLSVAQGACQGHGKAQAHHVQQDAGRHACVANKGNAQARLVSGGNKGRIGQGGHLRLNTDDLQHHQCRQHRRADEAPPAYQLQAQEKGKRKPTRATNIPSRTSIHDQPNEADGTCFGDWEMDLIVDSCGHVILVLLDRHTGFVLLERLKHGKKAKPLAKVVVRILFGYRKYMKTIKTDNGSELAAHLDITAGLRTKGLPDVTVYFADSYCSWQKGAVENVNKLIRQYI